LGGSAEGRFPTSPVEKLATWTRLEGPGPSEIVGIFKWFDTATVLSRVSTPIYLRKCTSRLE
jgi:hypothetical protein